MIRAAVSYPLLTTVQQERSNMTLPRIGSFLIASCLVVASGCQPSATTKPEAGHAGHDHGHDHASPDNLGEAVAAIKEIHEEIGDALKAGKPEEADHAVHEMGDVLAALPKLAEKASLPPADLAAINAENGKLFDIFDGIDKVFHSADGDKQAVFSGAADGIQEAIATMEALVPEGIKVSHDEDHEGHDHDGEDHDDKASE